MRKFIINVNGKSYEVEVEEITQGGAATPSVSAPAATPTPAPAAEPAPAPTPAAPAQSKPETQAPSTSIPQGLKQSRRPCQEQF